MNDSAVRAMTGTCAMLRCVLRSLEELWSSFGLGSSLGE